MILLFKTLKIAVPAHIQTIIKPFARTCQCTVCNGSCSFADNLKVQRVDLSIDTTVEIGGQLSLWTNAPTYSGPISFLERSMNGVVLCGMLELSLFAVFC